MDFITTELLTNEVYVEGINQLAGTIWWATLALIIFLHTPYKINK